MSLTVQDIIDRLPFELMNRIESDDYFKDVPVVVAEEGNVRLMVDAKQAAISTKLGTKRGVAVIVLQIVADDEHTNLQFGPMTLRPAIQVIENVELNRDPNGTHKSARQLARRIIDLVKVARFEGIVAAIEVDKPALEPVNIKEDMGAVLKGYQVNFKCLEIPDGIRQQVQEPVVVGVGPTTPGANVIPAGAQYNANPGELYLYYVTGLVAGKQYLYTPGANDVQLAVDPGFTGPSQLLTAAGVFTAGAVNVLYESTDPVGSPGPFPPIDVTASIIDALPHFGITCPTVTEGLLVYYTTDDSYPRPGNPNAHAYGSPVLIPSNNVGGPTSVIVRACGYVPGWIPSQVARKEVTVQT